MTWHIVTPIPIKRRVRFTRQGHAFTDQKTKDDLKRVAESYDGERYECAVGLIIEVYKPLKSATKRQVPFTQKPDVDNVLKAVLDGLNGLAFLDDAQVVRVTVVKVPRSADDFECVRYCVFPIGGSKNE